MLRALESESWVSHSKGVDTYEDFLELNAVWNTFYLLALRLFTLGVTFDDRIAFKGCFVLRLLDCLGDRSN